MAQAFVRPMTYTGGYCAEDARERSSYTFILCVKVSPCLIFLNLWNLNLFMEDTTTDMGPNQNVQFLTTTTAFSSSISKVCNDETSQQWRKLQD